MLGGDQLYLLLIQFLTPVLLLPLFNTFTPVEDPILQDRIRDYATRESFRFQGIYTMDGSRRSTKLNAFFTGFGPFKKIVFYDTLLARLSHDEILAVLAHEMGHYRHHHLLKQLSLGVAQWGLLFFLMSLTIDNQALAHAVGLEEPSVHCGLLLFLFLYSPIELLLGTLTNFLSRKYEFEADHHSCANDSSGAALIGALKKLSKENLSNPTPHPFYVAIHYSHPPLAARISKLNGCAVP